ncbi:MAG TPA: ROK family transcriptional regulator [Acidobacteriaceae bacterium]|nr:ROK family transcriptional regulator [Acidobacteriaceae bacterium]
MQNHGFGLMNERALRQLAHVPRLAIQASSSETARDNNRTIILELIRLAGAVSRADLARLSGLQKSTVSAIVEELLESRWICEGETGFSKHGRRPLMLGVNNELGVVILDLHPGNAIVAVSDFSGKFLVQENVSISSEPQRSIAQLLAAIKRVSNAEPTKAIQGVGISVPGRVDPVTGRLVFAPNLRWENFDIGKAIAEGTGLPVEIENAANLIILAERWFGSLSGVQDAVAINVSEGIGTGIVAGGHLISGWNGMAGEFGHMIVEPGGAICGCGNRGCWETVASNQAALRHYRKLKGKAAPSFTYRHLLVDAEDQKPEAMTALRSQFVQIARGLQTILAGLSPEVVLFAGDIVAVWPYFSGVLNEELTKTFNAKLPRIITTADFGMARLRGALALVLQHHFTPASSHAIPRRITVNEPAR